MDKVAKRRLATIEAALRNSNYRVAESQEGRLVLSNLFCECGDHSCKNHLTLSVEDYDRVRSDPQRFFVAPGHDVDGLDAIVERHRDWIVVEKTDDVAPTLDAADERA